VVEPEDVVRVPAILDLDETRSRRTRWGAQQRLDDLRIGAGAGDGHRAMVDRAHGSPLVVWRVCLRERRAEFVGEVPYFRRGFYRSAGAGWVRVLSSYTLKQPSNASIGFGTVLPDRLSMIVGLSISAGRIAV
jgi:hypothetical protein